MSNRKRKDSWDTTSSESRSRSLSNESKSSWSSKSEGKSSYSSFSSGTEVELRKSKLGSNESLKKSSKSLRLHMTGSNDSLASSQSNQSTCDNSDNFSFPTKHLPLNVLRLLSSVRESEINAGNLMLKYESNHKKVFYFNLILF